MSEYGPTNKIFRNEVGTQEGLKSQASLNANRHLLISSYNSFFAGL